MTWLSILEILGVVVAALFALSLVLSFLAILIFGRSFWREWHNDDWPSRPSGRWPRR